MNYGAKDAGKTTPSTHSKTPLDELRKARVSKRDRIKQMGFNPYANDFYPSETIAQIRQHYSGQAPPQTHSMEPINDRRYSVAGRVLVIRSFGKAAFFHIMDSTGKLQLYVRKDRLTEKEFNLFKQVDGGDFIGCRGYIFYTKTGELTLMVENLHFLTKALRPLPEKYHGLADPELRFRQRYLDLIANPQVKEIFIVRSMTINYLRQYLQREGFIEVETPMLHPLRGGATARPFKTHHNALGMELYLRIAPELYLKRLLVGGFDKVFELGKAFRNEGVSTRHNPEFTILEFYEAYADYKKILTRSEEMIKEVENKIHSRFPHLRERRQYDIQTEWKKLTMVEAICTFGKEQEIDRTVIENEKLSRAWYEKYVAPEQRVANPSHGQIIFAMFENLVEPSLGKQPTCIIGFPRDVSPLARPRDEEPFWVDRFEIYLDGREIINAFSELNDPQLQSSAFTAQVEARNRGDEEAMDYDVDYIVSLEHGMPPAGGFGLGVDRLVMSLCQVDSIREVILFPAMRSNLHKQG